MKTSWITTALLFISLALPGLSAWAEEVAPAGPPAPAPVLAPVKAKKGRARNTQDESESRAERRRLLLATGEDKTLDIDFNIEEKGVSIGNPGIVTRTLVSVGDKKQIVFKPLKAGDTNVVIRDEFGTIRLIYNVKVTGSNILRQAAEIRDLLKDIEGLDIKVVGQKIVADGEILVPSDYARVLQVVTEKPYSESIMNLTTLSPIALQLVSKKIMEDVNTFAPNVKTRVVNGMIFLEGSTDSLELAKRAADVAKLYLPEARPGNVLAAKDPTVQILQHPLVQNFIVVNPPPPKKQEKLVRVTIHFVELSKDYNNVFGFKWQPGFTSAPTIAIGQSTTGQTQTNGPSFSAIISNLFPKLASAQDAGYARVIKQGTVIVRSGQPAKLEELMSYPFTTLGPNNTTVGSAKDVGLSVAVTPLILGQSEDIQLELDLQQSNVVGRTPSGSAPLTSSHKVQTKLYVKSNESAAVAGVNAQNVSTDFNRDDPNPGNFSGSGGTDALFTLKRTKMYYKKKSQFVIFVTPQIAENASEGTEDMKRNFRVKVQ